MAGGRELKSDLCKNERMKPSDVENDWDTPFQRMDAPHTVSDGPMPLHAVLRESSLTFQISLEFICWLQEAKCVPIEHSISNDKQVIRLHYVL